LGDKKEDKWVSEDCCVVNKVKYPNTYTNITRLSDSVDRQKRF